jgi:hypothetical protein
MGDMKNHTFQPENITEKRQHGRLEGNTEMEK